MICRRARRMPGVCQRQVRARQASCGLRLLLGTTPCILMRSFQGGRLGQRGTHEPQGRVPVDAETMRTRGSADPILHVVAALQVKATMNGADSRLARLSIRFSILLTARMDACICGMARGRMPCRGCGDTSN